MIDAGIYAVFAAIRCCPYHGSSNNSASFLCLVTGPTILTFLCTTAQAAVSKPEPVTRHGKT